MCFGGGGGDGGASAAAQAEKQRRARIQQGMTEIDRIFGGGNTVSNPVTNYQVGSTYYLSDGTPVVYDSRMIGDTPTPLTPMQKQGYQRTGNVPAGYTTDRYGNLVPMETQRQATGYLKDGQFNELDKTVLYGNVTQNPGFDDAFFDEREQAYRNYAMPQLEDQYADAKRQIIYSLSRSGLLNSSVAADKQRRLGNEFARYQTDVGNAAQNFANDARRDVENARSNLVMQLNATEDPASTARMATTQADILSRPPTFDPVGMFAFQTAQGLENSANRERARQMMAPPLMFGSSGNSSSSVTRA